MPRALINGVNLYYESDGEGDALIVLHGGLGVDHVVYRRTLEPLGEGRRLIFPDHRGNGRSDLVDLETITIDQLADDIAALADHLGLDRFSVLGHSYGGFIAQELAIRHGARLDQLILVATTPGQLGTREEEPSDDGVPQPSEEQITLMSSMIIDDAELEQMMWKLLPYYFHDADMAIVNPLFEDTTYRLAAMMRGFEVLASWSSIDRLPGVDVPTLVLVGRHDVFTSWPQSYRIANRLPNAEVVVLEESGHFPWIQQPDEFFSTLGSWFARSAPQPGNGRSNQLVPEQQFSFEAPEQKERNMKSMARRMFELVEPIGVIPYSADEPNEAMFALGFTNYWDTYFAGRAAPLGLVPAEVVDALFYNFAPGEVARHIPKVWLTTTPEAAIAARQAGCTKALRRILGDHVDAPGFARAAELLLMAATSAPSEGRPMYAALRSIPIPDDIVARLFHAASLLREHRGDGHIAALMIERVGGLEAHVLLALDMEMPAAKFGRIHHLPGAQLSAVIDGMRDRGLIGDDGWLSDLGRAVKQRVEAFTDDLAAKPYESLEAAELDELMATLEPLATRLLAAQNW